MLWFSKFDYIFSTDGYAIVKLLCLTSFISIFCT